MGIAIAVVGSTPSNRTPIAVVAHSACVAGHFAQRRVGGDDEDWCPAGHRLEHRDAETLVTRRQILIALLHRDRARPAPFVTPSRAPRAAPPVALGERRLSQRLRTAISGRPIAVAAPRAAPSSAAGSRRRKYTNRAGSPSPGPNAGSTPCRVTVILPVRLLYRSTASELRAVRHGNYMVRPLCRHEGLEREPVGQAHHVRVALEV